MVLYLSIIGFSLTTIFLTNVFLSYFSIVNFSFLYAFLATIIYFVLVFSCDIIGSLFIRFNYSRLFEPTHRVFRVFKWENRWYRFLRIYKWKDKIPELGKIAHFEKTKISSTEAKYIYKFAKETVYAEVMHYFMALCGLAILFIPPLSKLWTIALPIAIINFILQIPPIMVQRYNRPKLMAIYEREVRREKNTSC